MNCSYGALGLIGFGYNLSLSRSKNAHRMNNLMEVIIPLTDISDVNFASLNVELKIEDKTVFTSGNSLNVKALVFKDKKLQTGKTVAITPSLPRSKSA